MKVSSPSIAGAVEILKDEVEDLDKIIALPVFLAPGIHTNIDIPILLGLDPLEEDPRCPDGNYPDEHYLSIADDVDFDGVYCLITSNKLSENFPKSFNVVFPKVFKYFSI